MDIFFRDLTTEDAREFWRIRDMSREFLHNPSKFTLDEFLPWFEENRKDYRGIFTSNPWSYKPDLIGYFRLKIEDAYLLYLKSKVVTIGADLDPFYRGRGIGELCYKKLMEELEKQYRDEGINNVFYKLEVLGSNTRAYRLYRKLGFVVTQVEDTIREGKIEPSISMRLNKSI